MKNDYQLLLGKKHWTQQKQQKIGIVMKKNIKQNSSFFLQ
jgi:hypothetical protein